MKWTRQKDWTCKSWDGLLARSSGYKDCELWEEPFAGLAVSISACSMCETSYACLSRVLIDSSDPVRDRWRCTIYSFHDFDLMIVCLLMVFWQSYSQTYATEELVAPASHNCIGYEIGTPSWRSSRSWGWTSEESEGSSGYLQRCDVPLRLLPMGISF